MSLTKAELIKVLGYKTQDCLEEINKRYNVYTIGELRYLFLNEYLRDAPTVPVDPVLQIYFSCARITLMMEKKRLLNIINSPK